MFREQHTSGISVTEVISTAKNPTYTYFTPGTYRIELVVTGPGGTSMKTQVVNAYASPKAYFEVTPPMVYVNDERIRCFNLSQGATSYLWDFGDGDTSKVKEPYPQVYGRRSI